MEQIHYNDDSAVYKTDIKGWISRRGIYYAEQERMARMNGCTHLDCIVCNKTIPKNYHMLCKDCRKKDEAEKYKKMEKVEWDGTSFLYSSRYESFFESMLYAEEFACEKGCRLEDLLLLQCVPNRLREVPEDYFWDYDGDEVELPGDIEDALLLLNALISESEPYSWSPGNKAIIIKK